MLFRSDRRARYRLSSVVQPLLSLISDYTGFKCVSLIAASATPDDTSSRASWVAVHHGKTRDVIPKDFAAYDKDGFADKFVGTFLDFVQAVGHGELPV